MRVDKRKKVISSHDCQNDDMRYCKDHFCYGVDGGYLSIKFQSVHVSCISFVIMYTSITTVCLDKKENFVLAKLCVKF